MLASLFCVPHPNFPQHLKPSVVFYSSNKKSSLTSPTGHAQKRSEDIDLRWKLPPPWNGHCNLAIESQKSWETTVPTPFLVLELLLHADLKPLPIFSDLLLDRLVSRTARRPIEWRLGVAASSLERSVEESRSARLGAFVRLTDSPGYSRCRALHYIEDSRIFSSEASGFTSMRRLPLAVPLLLQIQLTSLTIWCDKRSFSVGDGWGENDSDPDPRSVKKVRGSFICPINSSEFQKLLTNKSFNCSKISHWSCKDFRTSASLNTAKIR